MTFSKGLVYRRAGSLYLTLAGVTGIQMRLVYFKYSGIQVDWYTGITVNHFSLCHQLTLFIVFCHTPFLFITCGHNFSVYSKRHYCNFVYNLIVTLFILGSLILMFIHHTNAPVEVSVSLGGKVLWNAGAAFCD